VRIAMATAQGSECKVGGVAVTVHAVFVCVIELVGDCVGRATSRQEDVAA
jgi:hypothetical protein